jgi:antitoxin component YwqK of YwqJK toxin-antitoxin module
MTPITNNQWIEAVYKTCKEAYLDPVYISFSLEKQMTQALRDYNQIANNKFIAGLIEAYDENGTLSEKQWYYLVRMYLKLDEVVDELNSLQTSLPSPANKLKSMLANMKGV